MKNNIKNSEHIFIAGKTGSGKSMLAYYYLSGFQYVRVLDIKGKFYPDKFTPPEDYIIVDKFSDLSGYAKEKNYIIYRPCFEELDPEYYNEFFKWCYLAENNTVCVDEVMGLYDSPFKILPYHKAILTRGRELNVNMLNLTQRPAGIPQLIISEATHFYVFNLTLENDRIKVANITGQEDVLYQPGKYIFWYYNFDMETPKKGKLNLKD